MNVSESWVRKINNLDELELIDKKWLQLYDPELRADVSADIMFSIAKSLGFDEETFDVLFEAIVIEGIRSVKFLCELINVSPSDPVYGVVFSGLEDLVFCYESGESGASKLDDNVKAKIKEVRGLIKVVMEEVKADLVEEPLFRMKSVMLNSSINKLASRLNSARECDLVNNRLTGDAVRSLLGQLRSELEGGNFHYSLISRFVRLLFALKRKGHLRVEQIDVRFPDGTMGIDDVLMVYDQVLMAVSEIDGLIEEALVYDFCNDSAFSFTDYFREVNANPELLNLCVDYMICYKDDYRPDAFVRCLISLRSCGQGKKRVKEVMDIISGAELGYWDCLHAISVCLDFEVCASYCNDRFKDKEYWVGSSRAVIVRLMILMGKANYKDNDLVEYYLRLFVVAPFESGDFFESKLREMAERLSFPSHRFDQIFSSVAS